MFSLCTDRVSLLLYHSTYKEGAERNELEEYFFLGTGVYNRDCSEDEENRIHEAVIIPDTLCLQWRNSYDT